MRERLCSVLVLVACAVGALGCRTTATDESPTAAATRVFGDRVRPGSLAGFNLLFISVDTLRRDHIGCYGDPRADTPAIDRLAATGVVFDHAVTAAPSTLPSHCTMFTGLEVPNHGVRTNGKFTLSRKVTTLAELLGEAGYDTAAVVATFVLSRRFGLSQGFDHYSDTWRSSGGDRQRRAADVTDTAIGWLDRWRARAEPAGEPGAPFFLWAHYFDPHRPFDPPEPHAGRFADRPYDGEIAYADEQIGRLLDYLDEHRLSATTLIVLTSDHGEGLGEHGEKDHSRLIYDTTMRVPLLFSCPPALGAGVRVGDVTVGTVDLTPTILSLLGVETDLAMDGFDLVTQAVPADRAIYIETLAGLLYHGWAGLHGLRRVDSKYVAAPTPEYFDLATDPHELTNLHEADSDAGAELAGELTSLLAGWPDDDDVFDEIVPRDAATMKRLAALGYIETDHDEAQSDRVRPDPKDYYPVFDLLARYDNDATLARVREIVLDPDRPSGQYRQALILTELLVERRSDNATYRTAHGMALLRVNRAGDALGSLREARRLHPGDRAASESEAVMLETAAFEAMALCATDRHDEGRAELARLEELGKPNAPGGSPSAGLAALLHEAETACAKTGSGR